MKTNICIICLFLISFNAYAELSCSNDQTKIIYINGVKTPNEKKLKTDGKLTSILVGMVADIDKNSRVDYYPILNESFGLENDLQEALAGLAEQLPLDKRTNFWMVKARNEILKVASGPSREFLHKQANEAFNQIYGKKYLVNPKTKNIELGYYTEADLYGFQSYFDLRIATFIRNAAASEAVIENLKNKIEAAHDQGANKVLVIAHSQGNIILQVAVQRLLWENFYRLNPITTKWFKSTVGYVQLAVPSTNTSLVVNRHVTLDIDTVIAGARGIEQLDFPAANYESVGLKPIAKYGLLKSALSFFNVYNKITPDMFYNHGIDEIYLSDALQARKIGGETLTMLEHFKNAVKEVASELKSNCVPDVKPFSALCYGEEKIVNNNRVWKANGKIGAVILDISKNTYQGIENALGNECVTTFYGESPKAQCIPINPSSSLVKIKLRTIASKADITVTAGNPCYDGRELSNYYEEIPY